MTACPAASSSDDVVLATGDRLLASREVGKLGDEAAHRPAGHEEPGLLAQQLRGTFLEGGSGGVLAEDVVAHLGFGHGPPHLRRWLGDGVRTEVDDVHGRRV